MGEVVLYRPREGQSRKNIFTARSGGQVVFFTGVRYERMPDAGDSGAPPAGGLGGAGRGGRRRRG
jgi:hypothetical protein